MSRSTRMFEIIQILRAAQKPVTADRLAEDQEVSARTIYRDMAALQAMAVPIEGEAGVGYIMRPGYDLPPLAFTAEELEALSVGLALLQRTSDSGLKRAAKRIAEKLASLQDTRQNLPDTLHVSGWTHMRTPGIDLEQLRGHIRREEELTITYCDLKDCNTKRQIYPLALIYYVDVLVLAGWCKLRKDFRHFRVDRISSLEPSGGTFGKDAAALRKTWAVSRALPEPAKSQSL